MSAPDEQKREGLKGKPIVDKIIANQKPLPKPPMKPPQKGKKPKTVGSDD